MPRKMRTLKFRLYPTTAQKAQLEQAFAAVRMVYNAANEQRRMYSEVQGTDRHGRNSSFNSNRQVKEVGFRDCKTERVLPQWKPWDDANNKFSKTKDGSKERAVARLRKSELVSLSGLRDDPELSWLYEYAGKDQFKYALDSLDMAWDKYFDNLRKRKPCDKPKFRSTRGVQSLTYRIYLSGKACTVFGKDCVKVAKIGWIKYNGHARLRRRKLHTATIVREDDIWSICVATSREVVENTSIEPRFVGVDLGTTNPIAIADSTGLSGSILEAFDIPTSPEHKHETTHLRKALSRKQKGSKKRNAVRKKLAAKLRKEAARKRLALHKITTDLVRNYTHIAVEDLSVKKMTESGKSRRKSGKKVISNQAQANFNRTFLDVPKYMFRSQLEYKAAGVGHHVLSVDPAYTSQTCKACGSVSKVSRVRQEKFHCSTCGHEEHADEMAAFNILNKAFPNHRLMSSGYMGTVAGPMLVNQQTTNAPDSLSGWKAGMGGNIVSFDVAPDLSECNALGKNDLLNPIVSPVKTSSHGPGGHSFTIEPGDSIEGSISC
jgi:putative transposase